ncbi:HD-GYP domain, c-di-GMP phosphodiesterase class II (or its inactivated variant) [Salinibacillus kushneri]|uniref:HD-GYP domain, c-di-GMP phosphodiesterase class II (Or its inactivated variant) n=1 Tax=Salinibacillus kushneri TaxID=237682 RepID=A0A1I0C6F6_9BACI|nr:HD-GYP domain-containing protein [Salinibacillus kushneri]SET14511.1 HD-GYP domain, c-di-GMP phosphodiesterase class II (or its inactivated variant) [Salinibacillus kushneri]
MLVHPSQLKPGCIVEREVKGKTVNPIIPKETVIQPIHIKVLKHFCIKELEVSSKLVDGENFIPGAKRQEEKQETKKETEQKTQPFAIEYAQSVNETKEMFLKWQARNPVNISKIREFLIPLILKAENDSGIIFSLHHHVDKENYFYHHFVAKALIGAFIAKRMKLSQGDRIQVALAAYLSDCGMAQISEKILNKTDRLSAEEFKEVQQHPIYSYRWVENIASLKQEAKLSVLQHHERLDGNGYPFGLKHQKIDLYARIIAVSDIFHAMVSERVYKPKQSPFKAVEEIKTQQLGKLDLEVVNVLVTGITHFSNGTKVKLSDQRIGEIVFIENKDPTRPIIRINESDEMIILKDNPQLHIEEILA